MAMKSLSTPRRVYSRNGVTHVLFAGTVFGAKETAISTKYPVRIEGGEGQIKVTQRAPKKKGVTETWKPVKVPVTHRA